MSEGGKDAAMMPTTAQMIVWIVVGLIGGGLALRPPPAGFILGNSGKKFG